MQELAPNSTYHFQIRALFGGPASGFTPTVSATTPALPVPSNLSIAASTASSVSLTWDTVSGVDGYSLSATAAGLAGASEPIKDDTINEGFLNNLSPGGTYTISLSSVLYVGNSVYQSVPTTISFTTPTLPTPPAPTNLQATAISGSEIDLNWQDNSDGTSPFQVWYSIDGSTFSLLGSTGQAVNIFDATTLAPDTQYYFEVRAGTSSPYSGYSNVANATTTSQLASLTPPTNLSATASTTTDTVTLNWTLGAIQDQKQLSRPHRATIP